MRKQEFPNRKKNGIENNKINRNSSDLAQYLFLSTNKMK